MRRIPYLPDIPIIVQDNSSCWRNQQAVAESKCLGKMEVLICHLVHKALGNEISLSIKSGGRFQAHKYFYTNSTKTLRYT